MRAPLNGNKRVLVVGAGFSGLTAAFYLSNAGFEVEILEMKQGPGGLIGTARAERGLVETGANGLINSRLVEDLFEEIGCPMIGARKASRARYVFRDGKPRRWPLTLSESGAFAGAFARYLLTPESIKPEPGESLRAWSSRALGAGVGRHVVEAGFQGIYAGDPERLSATLLIGKLFSKKAKPSGAFGEPSEAELAAMEPDARKEAEQSVRKARRRKLRLRGTVSAEDGMGQLIEKLEAHLKAAGVRIRYGARALPTKQDALRRPIVVAAALPQARELVEEIDPARARSMNAVAMLPIITVTGFYRGPAPRPGFGMLFAPIEKRRTLGVLFNNNIFDGRVDVAKDKSEIGNVNSETWILGGALAPEGFASAPDQTILDWVDEDRAFAFGSRGDRAEAILTRWPEALPHYTRELERRLPHFRENRANVFLIGNYLGQIGLAKIIEIASRLPAEILDKGHWG